MSKPVKSEHLARGTLEQQKFPQLILGKIKKLVVIILILISFESAGAPYAH